MTQIAAVILARMSSARLPGKALMMVQELTLLECIVTRLQRVEVSGFSPILATSTDSTDDRLVAAADKFGVRVFRGSRDDVMARFVEAAKACDAEYAARINADSPLVEPSLLREAVTLVHSEGPDFVTTKPNTHLPYGVAAEVVRVSIIEDLHDASSPAEREHVTTALYRQLNPSAIARAGSDLPCRPDLSLAIDTQADLERINCLVAASGGSVAKVAYWDL